MPTKEQLDDYFKRSGDKKLENGCMEENEHGFCVWTHDNESVILLNVYGDGEYWNNWAESKAKELGMNSIYFGTKRNPDAFCRKHGFEVEGYILKRGI